ncbi:hypothetical protein JQS43_14020 [Natronosporangium hydrolyticum]|uniref:Uncharacterized protein n=1 Tax=Natronosporangium hydrolyticum TaxID=2811111 RepID=A0A895Y957_9ACTN|nr:hypothetical protein [Natronosporangium hydrolyticum]QSB12802.1 hypothetical protein JQS43_14020 [Natronosporangium hydrolyticum]
MPAWNLAPSRAQPVSPSHYRRGGGLVVAMLLLLGGLVLLLPGFATAIEQHRVERTIAADREVTAEVYRESRAVYRSEAGELEFARAPTDAPVGAAVELLVDPQRPGRLQAPEQLPPAGWIAPLCLAGAGAVSLAGVVLLIRTARRGRPSPGELSPRWQANLAVILDGPPEAAEGPQVRPWLPAAADPAPPTGRTGVLRFAWASPLTLAVLAGLFSFALPQLGGDGRGWVVAVAAVVLWLPAVGMALAAAVYRVDVGTDGGLTIRTLVTRRRYELSQLSQVTGWTWSIDRSTRGSKAGRQPAGARLACWNLGLHFRDGRHLFYSPTNVRDHELIGRAIRWWALRTRAAATPDMAYALGLVSDPRELARSPLPLASDDPVLRRPGRRLRGALVYGGHIALTFATIGALPAVNLAGTAVTGPAPDPRVVAEPCALVEGLDLAGPFTSADDPVAWQGCAAGDERDVWLSVSPSIHSAPRSVRFWLADNDAVATVPISDEALLARMGVDHAQVVVFGGGERVTITFIVAEVSGIASLTRQATDATGSTLAESARFDALVDLVRAVSASPAGTQSVRSFTGDGVGDRARERAIESALTVSADPELVVAWLDEAGIPTEQLTPGG